MIKDQGRRFSIGLVCLAVAVIPHSSSAGQMHIENHVQACLGIELGQPRAHENLIIAEAAIALRQTVGECGCKSAQIDYSVYRLAGDHEIYVIGGKLKAIQSRRAWLVLSPDGSEIIPTQDTKLSVGCAHPD